jgi:hypothetical protein
VRSSSYCYKRVDEINISIADPNQDPKKRRSEAKIARRHCAGQCKNRDLFTSRKLREETRKRGASEPFILETSSKSYFGQQT